MKPKLDVHAALMKGDYNLLRHLVESGADVNLKDEENRTALIKCCLHDGQYWAVGSARLLITYGAKVGRCDSVGRNALMYAIMYQREELVKLFLEAMDYDLTHTDKWDRAALWYASVSGNTVIITMLNHILKKYNLLSEKHKENWIVKDDNVVRLPTIASSNVHQEGPKKLCQPPKGCTTNKEKLKVNNGTCYRLPYKPIPADIWDKRRKFNESAKQYSIISLHKGTKDVSSMQTSTKRGSSTVVQDKSSVKSKEQTDINTESENPSWQEDFQNLIAMLEIKLSPSYCSKAKILPPDHRRYPKIPKNELDAYMAAQLPGKRRSKGRRLSFDTMDVLINQRSTKGNFRRRCSVAVIPLIRLKGCRSSLPTDLGKDRIKNPLILPKLALKK